MKDKFMNGLLTIAGKMQSNAVLSAIKDAFIDNMPVVITGSFAVLFQFIISTNAEGYISLANVPGMQWLTVLTPIWSTANYGCMNFMAVNICVLVAMHYAENLGVTGDKVVPALAIGSFITLVNTNVTRSLDAATLVSGSNGILQLSTTAEKGAVVPVTIDSAVASSYTSATGLFVGLVVGILATLVYIKLVQSKKLEIKLPDSVPPNVSASFAVLFPAVITLFLVAAVGFLVSLSGMSLFDVITALFAPLQKIVTGLPGFLVIVFLMQLLWWFGIHGPNVMAAVTGPFLGTAFAANNALYAAKIAPAVGAGGVVAGQNLTYSIISYPFNSVFFSMTGSGITGGLIIAILLFSKRDDFKAIAKLAIPCGIFNINEPIIFGIPMVMNPLMAIPFFLAPIASVSLGYFLTEIGFCPLFALDAPWTTPLGILGFLDAGGNIMGAVSQLLCFALSIVIYTPFVIAANKVPSEAAEA